VVKDLDQTDRKIVVFDFECAVLYCIEVLLEAEFGKIIYVITLNYIKRAISVHSTPSEKILSLK